MDCIVKILKTIINYPQVKTSIEIGTGLVEEIARYGVTQSYSSMHIVIDANVVRLHGSDLLKSTLSKRTFYALPSGEKQKSINSAGKLLHWLHDQGAGRRSLLIAIGGGVVTDLAGFAASTYMRGIEYISVPTTLVGQVDAAIGGKTAINLGGSKNIAGTFYPPKRVFCDERFLATLRKNQLRDGLVEAFKIFAARDSKAFHKHTANLDDYLKGGDLSDLVAAAVRLKVDVVNRDPFEKDLRRVLNFGHTTGHAYEAVTGNSHGKSVAFGIVVALALSRKLSGLSGLDCDNVASPILSIYRRFALSEITPQVLWERVLHDKKKSGSTVNFVLLKRCGEHTVKSVDYSQFARAYEQTREMLEA